MLYRARDSHVRNLIAEALSHADHETYGIPRHERPINPAIGMQRSGPHVPAALVPADPKPGRTVNWPAQAAIGHRGASRVDPLSPPVCRMAWRDGRCARVPAWLVCLHGMGTRKVASAGDEPGTPPP